MRVQNLYDEWSHSYDSDPNATRDLDQRVLSHVLQKCRFKSIIELGSGTGKNTELLARLGQHVHALDFSPGMIGTAKQRAFSNVQWSVANIARRWPCKARSADLATCNLVLEHIAKLEPVFNEAARVLGPGGWFFISELHPVRQYAGVVAKFCRGTETRRIPAFIHHLSDFLVAGDRSGFRLVRLQEWWHKKDQGKPPRLVSFLFEKESRAH